MVTTLNRSGDTETMSRATGYYEIVKRNVSLEASHTINQAIVYSIVPTYKQSLHTGWL